MACTQWPQPEQDSQANITWNNIKSVESSTKQHSCGSEAKLILHPKAAEDYIPLESRGNGDSFLDRNGSTDGKQLKRKLPNNDKTQTTNSHISTSESFNCTPWKTRNYVQNPVGLNQEIQDFLNYIKPRPEEDTVRRDVVDRVKAVIIQLWPQAKVELYGSCQTGLYLPTSDIDLVVHGRWGSLPLRTLENQLIEQEIADANSIRVLDKATVPIIKVTDKKTQVKIDISFNMSTGVQSAHMIKAYMGQYPALPCLAFVVKQFLLIRDLNEVFSGGISSYTVVLMIVSFFQYLDRIKSKEKDDNLGVLLVEFFEHYGKHFNYNDVGIRLVGNGSYFNKEKVLGKALANTTYLCIEDPLTQGNYIGKRSFRINDVKRAFEWACANLQQGILNNIPGNESSSILGRITKLRRDAIEQRERMLRLSPRISANSGGASYASIAAQSTNGRSPFTNIDSKTESDRNHESCKTRNNDKDISAEAKPHKSSASPASRHCAKDSQSATSARKERQSSRDKPQHRKNSSERTHSSYRRTPERDSIAHSPNNKSSSPKRTNSSTVALESYPMRSRKGAKLIKEMPRRPEKVRC